MSFVCPCVKARWNILNEDNARVHVRLHVCLRARVCACVRMLDSVHV